MDEKWREFERFAHLMQAAPWRFAKTMPDNPHHYTLREAWPDDATFDWAVQYLREHGYVSTYQGRRYTQIDVNEHFYWTMGAPLEQTILVNRKRRILEAPYDGISYKYDTLFRDAASQDEDAQLLARLEAITGPLSGKHVLDVGCGTGLLLRLTRPRTYLGIDPSEGMLDLLRHRHPDAAVIRTDLQRFAPPANRTRYDAILALYGVGSYLNDDELQRIPTLLAPGGKAIVMFYSGQRPHTYASTKINVEHRLWNPDTLPGEPTDFNAYRLVTVSA